MNFTDLPQVSTRAADFVAATRAFVHSYLLDWDDQIERTNQVPQEVLREVGRRGYFGLPYPEEVGGMGFTELETCLILCEFQKGPTAIGNMVDISCGIGGSAILNGATNELREQYLAGILSGEVQTAFALTEPNAGSDATAMRTTATPVDGRWQLDGTKWFVSNAVNADLLLVAALDPTAEPSTSRSITCFAVERETPGVHITPQPMMGDRGLGVGEVVLDSVAVTDRNIIGARGRGLRTMLASLDNGRLKCCAIAIAYAERAYELAMAYVRQREMFGQPLESFQNTQFRLADAATAIHAAKTVLVAAADAIDTGRSGAVEVAMAKLFVTESLQPVVDQMLQLLGGRGYSAEFPMERIYRNYRQVRIVEGASEVLRHIIARDISARPLEYPDPPEHAKHTRSQTQ